MICRLVYEIMNSSGKVTQQELINGFFRHSFTTSAPLWKIGTHTRSGSTVALKVIELYIFYDIVI